MIGGIVAGVIYTGASEWLVHKYILHGLGRKKDSFFAFHWHEHHRTVRKSEMRDADYERGPFDAAARGKEVAMLAGLSIAAVALVGRRWPWFTATAVLGGWNYYRCHKRSHLDPEWAREHLPWHVDHHMGPDQDANWGVTSPWMDVLMGTRKPYVGTELEAKHRAQAAERAKKRAGGGAHAQPQPEARRENQPEPRVPREVTPDLDVGSRAA